MKDLIVPIVFPEYKITVATPQVQVDLLPWVEFDNFTVPPTQQKLPDLGHAGVLLVNGNNGLTKYYEYGRYDSENKGIVRRVLLPDAKVDQNGVILSSLVDPLHKISQIAGHGGRIEAVLIESDDVFASLNEKILLRKSQNTNPNRQPYDVTSNSCIHFVKWVVEAFNEDTPWIIDPRPNSYIGEFRDDYPDLDYSPQTRSLTIEGIGVVK